MKPLTDKQLLNWCNQPDVYLGRDFQYYPVTLWYAAPRNGKSYYGRTAREAIRRCIEQNKLNPEPKYAPKLKWGGFSTNCLATDAFKFNLDERKEAK